LKYRTKGLTLTPDGLSYSGSGYLESFLLSQRIFTLDLLRTFAIVLMVIFHFIYDLKFFAYVDWDIPDGEGWRSFRHLILMSFFLCLGASLHLSHGNGILWRKFLVRLFQIAVSAAAITVMSLVMFPNNYIYFGVLHFIAVATIICIGFASKPSLSILLGILIISLYQLNIVSGIWPFTSIRTYLPSYSNDYVGIFPWLGLVFLGIGLGASNWFKSDPLRRFKKYSFLAKPGQHSLIIYLLHQPLFFGIFGLLALL
jgi:uncharacterized membrane protein